MNYCDLTGDSSSAISDMSSDEDERHPPYKPPDNLMSSEDEDEAEAEDETFDKMSSDFSIASSEYVIDGAVYNWNETNPVMEEARLLLLRLGNQTAFGKRLKFDDPLEERIRDGSMSMENVEGGKVSQLCKSVCLLRR